MTAIGGERGFQQYGLCRDRTEQEDVGARHRKTGARSPEH